MHKKLSAALNAQSVVQPCFIVGLAQKFVNAFLPPAVCFAILHGIHALFLGIFTNLFDGAAREVPSIDLNGHGRLF
jgi:hypothetical protein